MPSYLFCGEASPHSSSVGCNGIVVCDDLQTSLGNQFRVSDGGGAVGIRGGQQGVDGTRIGTVKTQVDKKHEFKKKEGGGGRGYG